MRTAVEDGRLNVVDAKGWCNQLIKSRIQGCIGKDVSNFLMATESVSVDMNNKGEDGPGCDTPEVKLRTSRSGME